MLLMPNNKSTNAGCDHASLGTKQQRSEKMMSSLTLGSVKIEYSIRAPHDSIVSATYFQSVIRSKRAINWLSFQVWKVPHE